MQRTSALLAVIRCSSRRVSIITKSALFTTQSDGIMNANLRIKSKRIQYSVFPSNDKVYQLCRASLPCIRLWKDHTIQHDYDSRIWYKRDVHEDLNYFPRLWRSPRRSLHMTNRCILQDTNKIRPNFHLPAALLLFRRLKTPLSNCNEKLNFTFYFISFFFQFNLFFISLKFKVLIKSFSVFKMKR